MTIPRGHLLQRSPLDEHVDAPGVLDWSWVVAARYPVKCDFLDNIPARFCSAHGGKFPQVPMNPQKGVPPSSESGIPNP